MKEHICILGLLVLLPACSGNPVTSNNSNTISINSDPAGARVYVMGEMAGTTPASIDLGTVYPVTFSQEGQNDYGRVVLKHDGCADKIITVSSRMISKGVDVKLDCVSDTESSATVPVSVGNSASQRLKQLQSLKDQSLITDEEYQKIRNRILQSL